jgi:membrane protein DedA with SNARE-associated domain
MLEHFSDYGYQGVFLALLAAGFGFPIPEELPVLTAGIMVGYADTTLRWYVMLPVVVAGVVIGDSVLYGMGRIWGRRLLDIGFIRRRFPAAMQEKFEKGFAERGIWVLLGVRLLPGIRAPAFVMAGVLRVPLTRFVLADAIYAIPLVNVLFWLAYFLTDQVMVIFHQFNEAKDRYTTVIVSHLLAAVAGALVYKYVIARHVTTGDAPHVPNIIAKPAVAAAHAVEKVVESVTGRHHERPPEAAPGGAADQEFAVRAPEPSANGTNEKPAGEAGAG